MNKTRIYVTTTGAAGSATGAGVSDSVIRGHILRVDVDYHTSAPATTDLTLRQTNEAVAANIVNLANQNTDKTVYPRVGVTDSTGAGLTLDGTRLQVAPYVCCDTLTARLADCDALTNAAVVDVYWQED